MCACSHTWKPEDNFRNCLGLLGIELGWSGMASSTLKPWTTSPTPTLLGELIGSLIGNRGLPINWGWLTSEPQGSAVPVSPVWDYKRTYTKLSRFSPALPPSSFSRWWEAADVLLRSSSCSPVLFYQHWPFPASAPNLHYSSQHLFLAAKRQLKVHHTQIWIPYLYHLSQAQPLCPTPFQVLPILYPVAWAKKTLDSSMTSHFQSPHLTYNKPLSIQNTNSYNLYSHNEISPINSPKLYQTNSQSITPLY